MDIELLSKMIGELIVDNDSVSLPGIGAFFATEVPASFSDKGYTINPPYRKLTFIQGESFDNLLVRMYAASNSLDEPTATAVLNQFLQELKLALQDRKSITLPGLGRLRATKENNFFFVPDQDLDVDPEGFGLKAVSLRNTDSSRDGAEPLRISVVPQDIPSKPAAPAEPAAIERPDESTGPEEPAAIEKPDESTGSEEPAAIEKPDESTGSEEPAAAEKTEAPSSPRSRWWIWPLALVAAAALFFAVFLLLAHVAPDFIDSLLYTEEELQIINY